MDKTTGWNHMYFFGRWRNNSGGHIVTSFRCEVTRNPDEAAWEFAEAMFKKLGYSAEDVSDPVADHRYNEEKGKFIKSQDRWLEPLVGNSPETQLTH
jgi:hypothetical protein